MKILTIRIETPEEVKDAVLAAVGGGNAEPDAGLSFARYEDMHRVLSPKRLDIVRAMAGRGPLSIRQVARSVGRDFKGVHTDVTSLVNAGVIDRSDDGIEFPYDSIHVAFDIPAAA